MDINELDTFLAEGLMAGGGVTVLTGAGISAESGIPTFRGPEGYWTVGSDVYHPQEIATRAMFARDPKMVWQFYLYRYGVCIRAKPNQGHTALVDMERLLPERFTLITQNVDGLHLRAGQTPDRTYQIHGNLSFVRCSAACTHEIAPLPEGLSATNREAPLTGDEWNLLHCRRCGALLRPHVLWFDECYNEEYFKFESTLKAAGDTSLLIVVGTAGATNLPNQVVAEACRRGAVMIDINTGQNPFGQIASAYDRGLPIQQAGTLALPLVSKRMSLVLNR